MELFPEELSSERMIPEDIRLAAKCGAVWMDTTDLNWVHEIDLSELRMSNCQSCVIGQAVGDYVTTIERAAWDDGHTKPKEWAVEHGFEAPNFFKDSGAGGARRNELLRVSARQADDYYADLEAAWTEEVLKRLG